jgi:hypothetical protein
LIGDFFSERKNEAESLTLRETAPDRRKSGRRERLPFDAGVLGRRVVALPHTSSLNNRVASGSASAAAAVIAVCQVAK